MDRPTGGRSTLHACGRVSAERSAYSLIKKQPHYRTASNVVCTYRFSRYETSPTPTRERKKPRAPDKTVILFPGMRRSSSRVVQRMRTRRLPLSAIFWRSNAGRRAPVPAVCGSVKIRNAISPRFRDCSRLYEVSDAVRP